MSNAMNLAELERKLIAAARANPPSDRVPYAFEKRIMARLAEPARRGHRGALGARLVARGGLVRGGGVALGAWFFLSPPGASQSASFDAAI